MNILAIIVISIISYFMVCFSVYLMFKKQSKLRLACGVLFATFVAEAISLNIFF